MSDESWIDNANIERAIDALSEAMSANGDISLLEWMQALRCMHAALRAQVDENIAELAKSRLDEHDEQKPAGSQAEEDGADE